MKERFCTQCGGKLQAPTDDTISTRVCSLCGTAAYENPLPVAACVILDAARQILLIKRRNEPHRGEWCLPTGFAESGESIGEAALRELREETGLRGRVARLLSVDSQASEFYGDLLFVSFEIERTGGEERAGDDAVELAYFAADRLPRLAFAAHEKAVAACLEIHRDEWAIQDSFSRLHDESPAGLLSDALVHLVEDQGPALTHRWYDMVRANPSTPTYADFDPGLVQSHSMAALSQFASWLREDVAKGEIVEFYRNLGRDRRAQGFALHELISALTLLRKVIWDFIREQHALNRMLDVYRVMELSRRVALFFDRALYQIVRGYEDA